MVGVPIFIFSHSFLCSSASSYQVFFFLFLSALCFLFVVTLSVVDDDAKSTTDDISTQLREEQSQQLAVLSDLFGKNIAPKTDQVRRATNHSSLWYVGAVNHVVTCVCVCIIILHLFFLCTSSGNKYFLHNGVDHRGKTRYATYRMKQLPRSFVSQKDGSNKRTDSSRRCRECLSCTKICVNHAT